HACHGAWQSIDGNELSTPPTRASTARLECTNSRLDSGEASNGTFYGTITKQQTRQVIDERPETQATLRTGHRGNTFPLEEWVRRGWGLEKGTANHRRVA